MLKIFRDLSSFGVIIFWYMNYIHDNPLIFSTVSVEACRRNISFNGSVAISKVESHHADARVYMLTHPREFDVVCIF